MLRWLTAASTLDLPGKIEEVNEVMLAKRLRTEDSVFVFFYEEEDIFAARLLKDLEVLDDALDKKVEKVFLFSFLEANPKMLLMEKKRFQKSYL